MGTFFNPYRTRLRILMLGFVAVVLLGFSAGMNPVSAQWMEPKRVRFGFSAGFGGLHTWGKPSFDVHWWNTTLRVSPGLNYISGGITQKLAYWQSKKRRDRILILSFYYHDDWFLANRKWAAEGIKKDLDMYMLMPGVHYKLDHRGYYYLEVSGGVMYTYETQRSLTGGFSHDKHHWLPMAEIRLGGIILQRKYYYQKFPMKPPKARRIKSRTLEFKN